MGLGQVYKPIVNAGRTGSAIIQVGKQARKVVVPRSSVYSDGIHNYVFVEEASKKEGRSIASELFI